MLGVPGCRLLTATREKSHHRGGTPKRFGDTIYCQSGRHGNAIVEENR
jgi:hypothetical protein